LNYFKLNFLTLVESFEAVGLNCREVNENVIFVLDGNESIPFFGVEPLYCSGFHAANPPTDVKIMPPVCDGSVKNITGSKICQIFYAVKGINHKSNAFFKLSHVLNENAQKNVRFRSRPDGGIIFSKSKFQTRRANFKMKTTLTDIQKIERSIHKKFRRELWRKFIRAVKNYDLVRAGDKIAVCISGGKDSFLMAKLFQQLRRLSEMPFELEFIVMNPGYDSPSFEKILENAQILHVPVKVFDSDIFEVVKKSGGSPCYLCARMRRGFLYSTAQNLGCNKIALGHHMSDVVETTLMGMFYGAQFQTMMPMLKSRNFADMRLIRPMYCIDEAAVIAWQKYNGLEFISCGGCPLAAHCDEGNISARAAVKDLLAGMKLQNRDVEKNVFNALQCINLETVIAYKKNGRVRSFSDDM